MISNDNIAKFVTDNDDDYKKITLHYDPLTGTYLNAVVIVKDFIRNNNVIIYGGTAIDMALRLKHSRIYEDDELPDFDFLSTDSIGDSYKIADILYNKGYENIRVVRAMHASTSRVDIGEKHWVADVSYMPEYIHSGLKYLMYDGMKVLHPDYQRIEMHFSLSKPFENPPMENIFNRWKKDIDRLILIQQHYPVEHYWGDMTEEEEQIKNKTGIDIRKKIIKDSDRKTMQSEITAIDKKYLTDMSKYIIPCGFISYSIYYNLCKNMVTNYLLKHKDDYVKNIFNNITPATFIFNKKNQFEFSSIQNKKEFVSTNIEKTITELNLTNCKHYSPLYNYIPKRTICNDGIALYDIQHLLLSCITVPFDGIKIKTVSIQYVLMNFIAKIALFDVKNNLQKRNTMVNYYNSLLNMIHIAEHIAEKTESEINYAFLPSLEVFGEDGYSETYLNSMKKIYAEIVGEKMERLQNITYILPSNKPEYDYENEIYHIDGRKIEIK